MKKAIVFLLLAALVSLAFVSCQKDVVTYCPFCSKANVKEISTYDKGTGMTNIKYQCTNQKCGKIFGAGAL